VWPPPGSAVARTFEGQRLIAPRTERGENDGDDR
jgi:hypothetical protein